MSIRSLSPFVFASWLMLATAVRAQDAAPLPVGTTARIALTREATTTRNWRRDADRWRGTIEEATADSFRLRLRDGRAYSFRWDEVASLERYDGHVSRSAGASRGARLGALWGAFLLGGAGAVQAETCVRGCDFVGLALPVGVVLGAGAGTLVGSLIGAAAPGEHWSRVAPHVRMDLGIAAQRPGLVLRIGT